MLSKVLFTVGMFVGVGANVAIADTGSASLDLPRFELDTQPLAIEPASSLDTAWPGTTSLSPPLREADATDGASLFHLVKLDPGDLAIAAPLHRLAVAPVAGIKTSMFAEPVATPDGDTHEANDDRAADAFFFAGFERRFTGLTKYLPR
jgi:hypothetical protein